MTASADGATSESRTIPVMSVSADGYAVPAELLTEPDGQMRGFQMLTGSNVVKAVPLAPDLVMWVGDDGFPGAVNVVPDHVCQFPGTQLLTEDTHGTVVFTGNRDSQDRLTALDTHWRGVIERASNAVRSGCTCGVKGAGANVTRTADFFCPVHRFRDRRATR